MDDLLASIRKIIAEDLEMSGEGGETAAQVSSAETVRPSARSAEPRASLSPFRRARDAAQQPAEGAGEESDRARVSGPGGIARLRPARDLSERAPPPADAPVRPAEPPSQPAAGREPAATPEQSPTPSARADDLNKRMAAMTDLASDTDEPSGSAYLRQPSPGGSAATDDQLVSQHTRQSVSASFEELSRTILTSNPRTLEDLVRDMMRPMLREWLEANLPAIVEHQVRQEIDRLSSRAG